MILGYAEMEIFVDHLLVTLFVTYGKLVTNLIVYSRCVGATFTRWP